MPEQKPNIPKTIAELRQTDQDGVSMLRKMADNGDFDALLTIGKKDLKSHLTYDDVMTRDADGVNVLMVAGWQNKLDALFDTALWKHGHRELAEVVRHMPRNFQKQIDGDQAVQTVMQNQFKYRERMTIKRRRPKP